MCTCTYSYCRQNFNCKHIWLSRLLYVISKTIERVVLSHFYICSKDIQYINCGQVPLIQEHWENSLLVYGTTRLYELFCVYVTKTHTQLETRDCEVDHQAVPASFITVNQVRYGKQDVSPCPSLG